MLNLAALGLLALSGTGTTADTSAWQRYWSEEHQRHYFYDTTTKVSQWENPFEGERGGFIEDVAETEPNVPVEKLCHLGPDLHQPLDYAIEVTSHVDPVLGNSSTGCTLRGATILANSVTHLNQVKIYLPLEKIKMQAQLPRIRRHMKVIKSSKTKPNETFDVLPDAQMGCDDVMSKPGYPLNFCYGGLCDNSNRTACRCSLHNCTWQVTYRRFAAVPVMPAAVISTKKAKKKKKMRVVRINAKITQGYNSSADRLLMASSWDKKFKTVFDEGVGSLTLMPVKKSVTVALAQKVLRSVAFFQVSVPLVSKNAAEQKREVGDWDAVRSVGGRQAAEAMAALNHQVQHHAFVAVADGFVSAEDEESGETDRIAYEPTRTLTVVVSYSDGEVEVGISKIKTLKEIRAINLLAPPWRQRGRTVGKAERELIPAETANGAFYTEDYAIMAAFVPVMRYVKLIGARADYGDMIGAEVKIMEGGQRGDELTILHSESLLVFFDHDSLTLTLTGRGTVASYQVRTTLA
jgi:hypothetical protein